MRTVVRGYKTELALNNAQITACKKHAGCARKAYNWGLARKQQASAAGLPMPNAKQLHKELNALKATEFPYMYEVSKCAPQEALIDLDDAFKHFFRKTTLKKQGQFRGKCGYPKFKSRKKGIGGFRLTGAIHVFEKSIQLPRLGRLRLKEKGYLPLNAKIGSATISEQAGRWYVAISVHEELAEPPPTTGPVIGVDLGVKQLAVVSDGREIANPQAMRTRLKKLRRLSRWHARTQKGSANRKKAHQKLARYHAKMAHIRADALHKATASLVAKTKPAEKRPAVIGIEDLNVSGMLKNRKLARAIADMGLSEFRRQLTYKAQDAGVQIHVVSRWEPSSKTCSCCGWYNASLALAERIFVCQECGLVIDRDLNAARNLELVAYLELMSTASYAEFDGSGQGDSGFLETEGETALVEGATEPVQMWLVHKCPSFG
ncbi:MAG: RNA-guided endonuclease InsQ/TnpB family protein [Ktedonobacteraceae bacterium]